PGSVEVKRFPAPSESTHRDALAQDASVIGVEPPTSATVQVPDAGSVELVTLPASSKARQSAVDWQTRPKRPWLPSTAVRVQAAAPPAGFAEARMPPALSPATHSDVD